MKRFLSIILVIAMMFCFASCKKKENANKISSKTESNVSHQESVVISQVQSSVSSSNDSGVTASKNTETSSNEEITKEVYPEKVLEGPKHLRKLFMIRKTEFRFRIDYL